MASPSPHRFPFDDDRPSGSVQPLSQADLQAILAHVGDDPDRALGPESHDLAQRADRQRARTAIKRVQAKQRAGDRTRDRQLTSERHSQPRSRQQPHGRGPERAAG